MPETENLPAVRPGAELATPDPEFVKAQQRKSSIQAMNPALRKVFHQLEETRRKAIDSYVMYRYEVGEACQMVQDDHRKYGAEAISKIMVAIGEERSSVYNLIAFARSWTRPELEKILKMRTADGKMLEWCHFIELMRISDPAERKALVQRILKESLTVRQLKDAISDAKGEAGQVLDAGTIDAQTESGHMVRLGKFARSVRGLHKRLQTELSSGFQEASAAVMETTTVSKAMLQSVQRAREGLEGLSQTALREARKLAILADRLGRKRGQFNQQVHGDAEAGEHEE